MQSYHVHYLNKYPGGHVRRSENSIDVYDSEGKHRVAMRKDGHGQFVCKSAEHGCSDVHDLSPIPKDSRIFKVVDGKIVRDDEADERESKVGSFLHDDKKKVMSCDELQKAKRYKFDDKQRTIKE